MHITIKTRSKICKKLCLLSLWRLIMPNHCTSYFPCNQGLLSQQDFLPTQNRLLLPLFPHQQLNKLAGCSEWMLAARCHNGHMVWQGLVSQNNSSWGCHHPSREFCTKQPTGSMKEGQLSHGNCDVGWLVWGFVVMKMEGKKNQKNK